MNKLIFGKNSKKAILSIEPYNTSAEIFYLEDGVVKSEFVPHKYWVLLDKPLRDHKCAKMLGYQHYKYGVQFDEEEDYDKFCRTNYKRYDIFRSFDPKEALMVKDGYTYFKELQPNDVSVLSFDIESSGLLSEPDHNLFIISNTFRNGSKIVRKYFSEDEYGGEDKAILAWIKWVREVDPTIITGHNVFGYDLPYLARVAEKYGIGLALGRDGSNAKFNERPSKYRVDGSQTWEYHNVKIYGREIIDTIFLSVKYDIGRKFPSWNLKRIIQHLKLEKEGREFYDASKIKTNWPIKSERVKIKKYCIDDSDDALKLYDLMIPPYFYMCQSIPKSFQQMINGASGSWLNSLFVRAYLQDKYSIPKATETDDFDGAFSLGIPGVYSNLYKVDVSSLYPSIMRHYNIYDRKKDPMGYFPQVVNYFTLERLNNKKLAKETGEAKFTSLEQAQKIGINSLYGFLGAPGLNFNSPENAAAVTRYGREILNKATVISTGKDIDFWKNVTPETIKQCEGPFLLANCDTDSVLIYKPDQSGWSEEEMDSYLTNLNQAFPELIRWEDDGYYDAGLILKAKNYVLRLADSGALKIKGSSITDSKREPALLEMIRSLINELLNKNTNIKDIYEKYVQEAIHVKDINRWAAKKSVTKAVLHPERLNEQKVYDALDDGDKIEGTKVLLFNDIEGTVQEKAKGQPVFYRNGEPKMVENCVLKKIDRFSGKYDVEHYVGRVYSTIEIFNSVLDKSQIIDYTLKKNFKKLREDVKS